MSNYKYLTPQLLLKAICNAIREKTGSTNKIAHQNIPDELDSILTEEECEVESQKLLDIMYGKDMKILDNKYISNIPYGRFFHNSKITTVNLPECTSIGNRAFQRCTNLTTVNLPECTTLGDQAFRDCTNLTTVSLPECTTLGYQTFSNCTNLTIVNLSKCTSIGSEAFCDCTNLTTIDLPECTSIGGYAFSNCTSLTTIDLPKCTSIDYSAFNNCTNLTTVILSNNQVATLGSINAFAPSPIANGTGYIYVPDNLVDSYKTATNWSNYANQIKPISSLPSNLKEEYGYV